MENHFPYDVWLEIGRVAHQLQLDHGHNAYSHAERLASKAERIGCEKDFEFWSAVCGSLKPR